jgi:hypothetical protein
MQLCGFTKGADMSAKAAEASEAASEIPAETKH